MKQRVADYLADLLVSHGVTDCFTVVGGGAMHLNDAFGHNAGLHCLYNHHEQACAIAAEAYARLHNKPALCCVTTGPGGTNAMTGVVGGWLDSIPMLVVSGQVRYDTTARSTGLPLRAMGDQEFDITKAVSSMTKYCEMVIDKNRIRYCAEKALYLATHGRPGPCWLDIPLNVQGAMIETDELVGFDPAEAEACPPVSEGMLDAVLAHLSSCERPVLYAGNGIRLSGAYAAFRELVDALNIPVVTCWDSIDAIEDAHPRYTGRGGIMGDRAGNFAVQNADCILAIGNRLSIRQVGYNWATWAREAYNMVVDIDEAELQKPLVHIDLPIHADAADFIPRLLERVGAAPIAAKQPWLDRCAAWKRDYPVVLPKHYLTPEANVYAFIKELSRRLPENSLTVVGNGSACVVGSHGYEIQKGSRFLINSAIASMGYDLPAAIGACVAIGKRDTLCVTGDGSLQMNLQELQTILTNRLPIRLYVINNAGYHSIRQTQNNLFHEHCKVGIGPESGDLTFPELSKLAAAYGYPYYAIRTNDEMQAVLEETLAAPAPLICEIFVSPEQLFEPKSASKRLPDGSMYSPPLEDLAPFLPRDELKRNMLVPMVDEQ
ncbi:MAG: thiamine pyrophosphate-binding protein [Eubacteriales bacterium]|nr:thiamine pyrophosphate-binding protein [Eubacteriales bacterium]